MVNWEPRFWAKVARADGDACWQWTAGRFDTGYGAFTIERRTMKAHRVSYELAYGPIPDGAFVCHRCDNPTCVRPDHLFLGTPLDNARDRDVKGRGADRRGERAGAAKLTRLQVRRIRQLYASGRLSQAALAARFGISQGTVHVIVTGKCWTEEGGPRTVVSRRPHSKLTFEQVREMRSMHAAGGISQAALAKHFGVSFQMVSRIVRGEDRRCA